MIDAFTPDRILCSFTRLRVETRICLSISARQEGGEAALRALKAQQPALLPVKSGKAPFHVMLKGHALWI